jgi:DNA-binding NarL/FixJ family response regulator
MGMRILIADDHTVVRDGLRYLLEAQSDLHVVGTACSGQQAVDLAAQLEPDVVVMDIAMPEMNGIQATQIIRAAQPGTQVVILTMYATHEHVFRALQAGVLGYLLKETAGQEVVDAVRLVYAGKRYLSQQVAELVVDSFMAIQQNRPSKNPLDRLSEREQEILQMPSKMA